MRSRTPLPAIAFTLTSFSAVAAPPPTLSSASKTAAAMSAAPPASMPAAKLAAVPATSAVSKPSTPTVTAKPAASSPAKPATKPAAKSAAAKKPTSPRLRTTEMGTRRTLAGGPTFDETALGADTPELRALAAAERELFPPSQRDLGSPWPSELPFPVAAAEDRPRVHASGLPPAPTPSAPPVATEAGKDLAWLSKLEMPDIPVRWDPRVVRYLEFFKDDPRGRATFTIWHKRSGRYLGIIKKSLRKKSLPEDLASLAMIESGFDPTARSPVGALGIWQFMPETGKIYGLVQDRWADQRMSVAVASDAAADHLADLNRRFGSWELAMAAYNMGYGGVLQAVRRFNTNDYWALSKLEGSLPWETTLYVPKILAAAIVTRNLAAFGFADIAPEGPLEGDEVPVAPGTQLSVVAQACGATTKEIELLNPELRASRTPPTQDDWQVLVPPEKAKSCGSTLSKAKKDHPSMERYVLRFGESLEQVAQARRVSIAKIIELNAITPGEVVRGGTVLLLPRSDGSFVESAKDPRKVTSAGPPVVIVPQDVFVYPDRKRVFYRVQVADTIKDVCTEFKVVPDEVRRWNDIDATARLVEGMTLQLFVPRTADLSKTVALQENEVHPIVTGTEEFFRHWDDKGRHRTIVTARAGETLEAIGKKHGVSPALMEKINRRGRSDTLTEGERVVVWTPGNATATHTPDTATAALSLPGAVKPIAEPTPPLTTPPAPSQLPPLR